jgi:hypothetical protein
MQTTISLCMIVRDEIERLESCLDSVAHLVDEVAILDTGSTDGTWDLVQVRAHRFDQIVWPDHFGQARNCALDLATCDWVLILDADETLVSGAEHLRRFAANPNALGAELRIDNDLGEGEIGSFWAARFFRRLPDLRFEGRIHEQVSTSIRRRCEQEPRWVTGQLDVVLGHAGYIPAIFEARGKAERNVRMLEASLAELAPDAGLNERVYLEYKLSTALGAGPLGQLRLLRAARMLLDASQEACASVPLAAEILASAGQKWSRGGEPSAAMAAVERAEVLCPGHPMIGLVRAQALLTEGHEERARAAFEQSLRGSATGFYYDRDAHDVAATIGLTEVLQRTGAHAQAIRLMEALKARHADRAEVAQAWVYVLIRAGEKKAALSAAVAYLRAHPGNRNALLACAAAAEALGMTERAVEWRAMATNR